MRVRVGVAAAVVLLLAGCDLPQRRPDARMYVSWCGGTHGAPADFPAGTNLAGSSVGHRECLRLDARDSATYVSGPARYRWSVAWDFSHADGTPSPAPTPGVLVADTAAAFSESSFFDHVAANGADAIVTLTVTDGAGRTREDSTRLTLRDAAPTLVLPKSTLRARSVDMLFSPYLVFEPTIDDADVDQTTTAPSLSARRNALTDEVTLTVVPQPGPDGKPLQSCRCSEVPQHFRSASGTPDVDPTGGDALAWCIRSTPTDDLTTTMVEGTAQFASLFTADGSPRFTLLVSLAEPHGVPHATPPDCNLLDLDSLSGCTVVQSEDALWAAAGPGNNAQGGVVGRVSADWRRLTIPRGFDVRDGDGRAEDGVTRFHWLAAQTNGLGAVVGVGPNGSERVLVGLGPVIGMESDPAGIWIHAQAADTVNNPAAEGPPGDRSSIGAGSPYSVFVPSALLTGGATVDLRTTPASQLTLITGYVDSALSFEFPRQLLHAGNDVLLLTAEICFHYDASAGACSSNTALPEAKLDDRLRDLGTPGASVVLAAGGGTALPQEPGGTSPLPLMAAAGPSYFWLTRLDAAGTGYQAELQPLPFTNAASVPTIDLTGSYPLGLAYDVSRDSLWVADADGGALLLIEQATQSPLFAYAAAGLSLPESIEIDGAGGVVVDDRLDQITRRQVYVTPDGDEVFFAPYVSAGIGALPITEPGEPGARGGFFADLYDLVQAPAEDPDEIPSLAYLPRSSAIAGIDPLTGSAWAIDGGSTTAETLFRIDADGGGVTPIAAAGAIRAGVEVPSFVLGSNQASLLRSMLWLAIDDTAGHSTLAATSVDVLRSAPASQLDLPDCPASDPLGLDRLTPCWAMIGGTVSHVPIFAGSPPRPIAIEQMRFSLDLGDGVDDLRLYVLGKDDAGTSLLAGYSLTRDRVDASAVVQPRPDAAQPLSTFETFAGSANFRGGAWLVQADGTAQRWSVAPGGAPGTFVLQPDPDLVVDPTKITDGTYRVTAMASNFFRFAFVALDGVDGGGQPSSRLYATSIAGSNGGFSIDVSTASSTPFVALPPTNTPGGRALAVSDIPRSLVDLQTDAWVTGDDGTLIRVAALPVAPRIPPQVGRLQVDYDRPADVLGTIGTTPAGYSLKVGAF